MGEGVDPHDRAYEALPYPPQPTRNDAPGGSRTLILPVRSGALIQLSYRNGGVPSRNRTSQPGFGGQVPESTGQDRIGTADRSRTCNPRGWNPVLSRLSFRRRTTFEKHTRLATTGSRTRIARLPCENSAVEPWRLDVTDL